MAVTVVGSPLAPGPSGNAFAVVKSDSTVFPTPTRSLWIGGTGDVVVTMNGGQGPITLTAVPAGVMLEISVSQVRAATTATNIVAFY